MNYIKILPIYCYNDDAFVLITTKKTTNPNYFHDKNDLDTQINTSDRLQNKQIVFSLQASPSFRFFFFFFFFLFLFFFFFFFFCHLIDQRCYKLRLKWSLNNQQ